MKYFYVILLLSCIICCAPKKGDINPTIEINHFVNLFDENENCDDSLFISMKFKKDGLLIHAYLEEDDIQAKFIKRDTSIYLENCFEIFLDPLADGKNYYEIEINALGTVLDLKLRSNDHPLNDTSNVIDWNIPIDNLKIKKIGTLNDSSDRDQFWSIDLLLPWDVFQEGPPLEGDKWGYNFMRIDYNQTKPEYWVYKPTGKGMIHYPDTWPTIYF